MSKNLKYLDQNRVNNFDLIRFLAASLVIYSHAYLVTNKFNQEPLKNHIGFLNLGAISVYVFFTISGYLITKSVFRQKHLIAFVKSRVLRIFPALTVSTLICAFVLGPIVTTWSLSTYFSSPDLYRFVFGTSTLLDMNVNLPGVFENNSYPLMVNSPLWTLKGEVLMYIAVFVLGVIKLLLKRNNTGFKNNIFLITIVFIYLISLRLTVFYIFNLALPNISFFVVGMAIYFFRERVHLRIRYMIILITITIICVLLKLPANKGMIILALSYSIFVLAYHPKLQVGNFSKYGDFSYGLYIYSFPIQQVLITYNPSMMPLDNFFIAYIIVLPLAIFSWYFIEKPSLQLKHIPSKVHLKTT